MTSSSPARASDDVIIVRARAPRARNHAVLALFLGWRLIALIPLSLDVGLSLLHALP